MRGFAARLNLARLTCLLLYSLVFEWRADEQPQFLAIFSTLTAMGCLHKEYERTGSFSRGAKTPGGKVPTWRKIDYAQGSWSKRAIACYRQLTAKMVS